VLNVGSPVDSRLSLVPSDCPLRVWGSRIEHPDAWLLPIPPLAESDRDENTVAEEREAELVLAGDRDTETGEVQS
jgi:hypothetical protein